MPDGGADMTHASAADRAACREIIRVGSRTFHAASYLLPSQVREPALALYAFCREADDAIDHAVEPAQALQGLVDRLDRAYRGVPIDRAADRAMADVVAQFAIPQEIPAALLEGFAWDAAGREYPDIEALEAYAARVAGTVGVMMSLLMGARSIRALARAADLGVAMQLSNIARDVGEDARMGRVYLPCSWLTEAGLSRAELLATPQFDPRLGVVVDRLVALADSLYLRAAAGVAELPPNCRPAIHAARLMYAEIGREVLRRAGDSVSERAVVPARRKALLLAQAFSAAALVSPAAGDDTPVLPAVEFLITAVQRHDARYGIEADPLVAESALTREWVRMLGTFERLEMHERQRRGSLSGAAVSPATASEPNGW